MPFASLLGRAMVLGFVVAAPLGPTGVTAVRHGLAFGAMTSFWIGIGAALTDFAYVMATYLGLTPLLVRLPWLTPVLYALGTFVLGRIGAEAIQGAVRGSDAMPLAALADSGAQEAGKQNEAESKPRSLLSPHGPTARWCTWRTALLLGFTVTVVNPATITSWLTIGGAFISAHLMTLEPATAIVIMLGVAAGSAVWFSILALLVALARVSLGRLPQFVRVVSLLSGLALLGFALFFLWKGATSLTSLLG